MGKLSYNQLVEKIITCKHSSDTNLVTEGDFPPSSSLGLMWHGGGGVATWVYRLSPPYHSPLQCELHERGFGGNCVHSLMCPPSAQSRLAGCSATIVSVE